MFFTRVGMALAWLAFVFGSLRLAIAVSITWRSDGAEAAAFYSNRYLGTVETGDAINQATLVVGFSIVLGVLTEISRSVRRTY